MKTQPTSIKSCLRGGDENGRTAVHHYPKDLGGSVTASISVILTTLALCIGTTYATSSDPALESILSTVQNPGFENGDINGVPVNWTDQWPGILKSLDSAKKHSGNYSWKFENDQSGWSGAYSDYIAVDPNHYYRLSVWIKSEYGTETATVGWEEYDASFSSFGWDGILYFIPYRIIPNEWIFYRGSRMPINHDTKYIRLRFFGPNKTTGTPGTIWWDDFSFEDMGDTLFSQYGYENNGESKSIDFGSGSEETDPISWRPATSMGDKVFGDPDYRALGLGKIVTITIPDFNVDADGLPLSPMLLEIAYRDTGGNGNTLPYVDSAIKYYSDDPNMLIDPDSNPNDPASYYTWYPMMYYKLLSIGGEGDGEWKYLQYDFPKTPFQLLRSIDGYFTFRIRNNTGNAASPNADLPIDYISLRVIDANECTEFQQLRRDIYGFYETEITDIGENYPDNYNNPNLTVFVRDPMKPVYDHTRPETGEIKDSVSGFSFMNETEPLSFSIYSKDGCADLTTEVTDLANNENPSYSISSPTVYRVVSDDKRLVPYFVFDLSCFYARIPDRIEEFSTITINPDSSQRFWMKIQTPPSIIGGHYEGTISIKKEGILLKSIPISFVVYDAELELPENINPVYHDPFIKTYSTRIDNVLDLFSETGFDPFYYIENEAIEPTIVANEIVGYDVSILEQRLERMINAGFAKDILVVDLSFSWQDKIYKHFFGGRPYETPKANLWDNLSNPNFVAAMENYIGSLEGVAADHGLTFIYSVIDEPGANPYRRIIADRIYTIVQDVKALATVTYCRACESPTSAGDYTLLQEYNGQIPALGGAGAEIDLIDFKIWRPGDQGEGYSKRYGNYGFFTNLTSYLRNPIYNRFLHGFLAFATDAKIISAYAMGDYVGDPFNDFDRISAEDFPYPDFVFAYPTWSGKLIPTMALEGIREGIKDAKYIATLRKLIENNPNNPIATDANDFLSDIKGRVNTDYWVAYPAKSTAHGYYQEILKDLSAKNNPNDYEVFTRIRTIITDYILALTYGIKNTTTEMWYQSTQKAIDDAGAGEEIIVYPGTYYEQIDFLGKAITLRSADPNDWAIVQATVIDANDTEGGIGVTFASEEGINSVLRGLTVRGGKSGVLVTGTVASPRIERCILEGNTANGIECNTSSPLISGCIVRGQNTNGNSAGISGVNASDAYIANNWIYGNSRGISLSKSGGLIYNDTLADNEIGVWADRRSSPVINNCILWNEKDDLKGCSATFSCIKSKKDRGPGNISMEPSFVDPANRDYHLRAGSVCIDAGDNATVSAADCDVDGNCRVLCGNGDGIAVVDMGADEYVFP